MDELAALKPPSPQAVSKPRASVTDRHTDNTPAPRTSSGCEMYSKMVCLRLTPAAWNGGVLLAIMCLFTSIRASLASRDRLRPRITGPEADHLNVLVVSNVHGGHPIITTNLPR